MDLIIRKINVLDMFTENCKISKYTWTENKVEAKEVQLNNDAWIQE